MTVTLLSLLIVSSVVVLFLLFRTPKRKKFSSLNYSSTNLDKSLEKLLRLFGSDVFDLIPSETARVMVREPKLLKLIKDSNNPWKLSVQEFIVLKFILGGLGVFMGLAMVVFLNLTGGSNFVFNLLAFGLPFILYMSPTMHYKKVANNRELAFKKEFPEALDYLTMAIQGGGYSLQIAFERVLKYLKDGVVKEEFVAIVNDLHTGKTIEATLLSFSERVPVQSIKMFCVALINANKLSVPIGKILRDRSEASRRDLEQVIEKKVSQLDSRLTMILSPTVIISVLLIVLSPAIDSLMKVL